MKNSLLNINIIKEYMAKGKYIWTEHCLNRLNQRNILRNHVKHVIQNGEIIEFYRDDYPYESCLIYGLTQECKILHVVCGISEEQVYIITAYYPDDIEWKKDKKTRRNQNELL